MQNNSLCSNLHWNKNPEVHTNLITFVQACVLLRILFKLVCLKGYCPTAVFLNRYRATKQTAVNAEQCDKDKHPYTASCKKQWNKMQRKEKLTQY